ncbi:helix-turn-helix transcriptional regulator [Streptomyces sp. NPDC048324]|uniref:helix-turn-helix domain-containing protein n=1 Tax=Streptomyces sp. NPDC048324 TaxID=3157205 RepID=UPI0034306281
MAVPVPEPEYAALIAELAALRTDRLRRRPSDRALAVAVGVSPTTIGDWLRANRFPQRIDLLLALVRAVRVEADHAALAQGPAVSALLEPQRWRRAYQAEARRRAEGTGAAVQAQQGRAVLEQMRLGLPLSEVTNPFPLEVHHAIGSPVAGLPVLPAYVPREHDHLLAEVVGRAAAGTSEIAVLVGGSSTGKTRACWEALNLLREQDEPWRLWHPIDPPTRPAAALAELADVTPYTVVWLNEAHFYLAPHDLGEQVAAGLRNLLREPKRGPVLVLATLWPNHWNMLTTHTEPDRHPHARELLGGHKIKVPDAFTDTDFVTLTDSADRDPRLAEAVEHALEGRITQYLAGVPVLMDRYEEARGATKALIHAAMDARRLGAGPQLSLALLADAAPGYLTDLEWDQTGDDWLQKALGYAASPCNGIPGVLMPVKRSTPRNQRNRHTSATSYPPAGLRSKEGQGPLFRLADYLDQHGRRHRTDQIPPVAFWTAIANHADPADLKALGDAAWDRGLYRDASQLHKHATSHGDTHAAATLVDHLHALHPADHRPAQWAASHAGLDSPFAVARLLHLLREVGAEEQVTALLARNPAGHVAVDNLSAVGVLLHLLREAGADEQFTILAERISPHIRSDRSSAEAGILEMLAEAGADEEYMAKSVRMATSFARTPSDAARVLPVLMKVAQEVGLNEQFIALAKQVDLGNKSAFVPNLDRLLRVLRVSTSASESNSQVMDLTESLPALGRFEEFIELHDNRERFRYGREPDGSSAAPWTWEDLE